jgi:hypothetical protein
MRTFTKLLTAAAMTAGVMVAAAPAHAVTYAIVTEPGGGTLPYTLPGNPAGVVPSGVQVSGASTSDFTFSTIGGVYKVLMQLQMSNKANGAPSALNFTLFSGTPSTGTSIGVSGGTPTAATLKQGLAPGNYYLELQTNLPPGETDLVTGGITLLSAVPEPATWATMILGIGLIGVAARRRRVSAAA